MGIKKAEILGPSATKQDQDKAQNSNKQYYMAESASGKDEANSAFWLATERARWAQLACSGFPAFVPQEKFSYWPNLFGQRRLDIGLGLLCVVIDLEFVSVHKNAKKKLVNNTCQYIDNPYKFANCG